MLSFTCNARWYRKAQKTPVAPRRRDLVKRCQSHQVRPCSLRCGHHGQGAAKRTKQREAKATAPKAAFKQLWERGCSTWTSAISQHCAIPISSVAISQPRFWDPKPTFLGRKRHFQNTALASARVYSDGSFLQFRTWLFKSCSTSSPLPTGRSRLVWQWVRASQPLPVIDR